MNVNVIYSAAELYLCCTYQILNVLQYLFSQLNIISLRFALAFPTGP